MIMLKNITKTIGIILLGIVGLCVLLIIVGYIVDLISSGPLKAMANKAKQALIQPFPDSLENGWFDYTKAIERVKNINLNTPYPNAIDGYIKGSNELLQKDIEEIRKYTDIYPSIYQGNNKGYCIIPFDFREGFNMKIPNYIGLQKVSKILAVLAMDALKKGDAEKSLEYTIQGLILSDRIINGGIPVVINYMVGIVIYRIAMKPLEYGVMSDKYDAAQLKRIRSVLADCEHDLPLLYQTFQGEADVLKINKYDFRPLKLRIACGAYFFSPRLALLRAINTTERGIIILQIDEEASFKKYDENLPRGYKYIEDSLPGKYIEKNPLLPSDGSNFSTMLRRKIEFVAKIRSLNLAAEIREFNLRTGSLPKTLDDLDTLSIIDPMSGKPWKYTQEGDSAIIQGSPSLPSHDNRFVYLVIKMR